MEKRIGSGQIEDVLSHIKIEVPGVSSTLMNQISPVEVILGESILNPGLQTSVRVHSNFQLLPIKVLDEFKGKSLNISVERPILANFGISPNMNISQTLYRLDNRRLINMNVEEFILHACDQTLLDDASTLVSKSWKCTTPNSVVSEVLRSCAGAKKLDIESCDPARDYIAENIHPFQVVAQQSNVALAGGNDPSFLHYMTFQDMGTHHFRSLKSLTKTNHIMEFFYNEFGPGADSKDFDIGYMNPSHIINHMFPCDFDLLSDALNGVGVDGSDQNSTAAYNFLNDTFSLFGSQTFGCGIGSGNAKRTSTNSGTENLQNACPDYAYLYLQKRQARMAMLESENIALRITVPWNPKIHAGKIIKLTLHNRNDPRTLNYGSGKYLVHSMTHRIKNNGYSTTVMDCVSQTVGKGVI